MSQTKGLKQRLREYYLYRGLLAVQLWTPFWLLWEFSQLRAGDRPDYFAATLVDVAFWCLSFSVAIPAGLIADRYGRKPALLIGVTLWCWGVAMWGLSTSFITFVGASAVWGTGAAFFFGTDSAYLYDTLLEAGRAEEYPKVAARATLLSFMVEAVAACFGGLLVVATDSLALPLLTMGAVWVAVILVVFRFPEPKIHRALQSNFLQQLTGGIITLRRHRALRLIITFQVLTGFVTYLAAFFRQDFLDALLGGDRMGQGLSFGVFLTIAAIAGLYAERTLSRVGEFGSLLLITLVVFPAIAAMFFIGTALIPANASLPIGLTTQAAFYVIWGLEAPIISTLMNRRVGSHERALMFGISLFLQTLVLAIFEPVVGLVALQYDVVPALMALSMVCLAPTLYILLSSREALKRAPGPVIPPVAVPASALIK